MESQNQYPTGLEERYVFKNNKKLRLGYTTGSCAAAGAKAAAGMLLTGNEIPLVQLMTPKGIPLSLQVLEVTREKDWVSCAIRKDGGDDPDATHGILIFAKVSKTLENTITMDGGLGVGRITKPGLEQAVGSAAINKVPRQMILSSVDQVCREYGYTGGLHIEISIPEGEEIAKKTFNPRLGIMGGLSILGTSGIVEPMSEAALIESIRIEMNMKTVNGRKYLLISPGNYGIDFSRKELSLAMENAVKCSNYIGETIDMAVSLELKGILFVSHIGKFIKVAGGIMNTHSRFADSRMEILAANAIRAGVPLSIVKEILDCLTTDQAIGVLKKSGCMEETMLQVIKKIEYYINHRAYYNLKIGVIIFSNEYGLLGKTENVKELMECLENYTE